jgi:hypothetical protein
MSCPSSALRLLLARPRRAARLLALLAGGVLALPAHAAPPARAPQPEDILPDSQFDDPIGLDRETRELERAVPVPKKAIAPAELEAERSRFGPAPPPLDVRKGEVLSAAPTTRELSHRVQVELEPSLASVRVEMSFESRSQKPSELRYRLAVPLGSHLGALEVCNARGCRQGLLDSSGTPTAYDAALLARGSEHPLPIARAVSTHDGRGDAIVVHAAPVMAGQQLTVRVGYLSPAPLHGGVVRLALPPRGMDPQVAPSDVKLAARGLLDPRLGEAVASEAGASFDPWAPVLLSARVRAGEPAHAAAWHFACGKQRCGWATLWAGPRPLSPVDLIIALDVSPSTEGPARGRQLAVIAALLAAAPEGSRVRALSFAARARALIEQPMEPSQVVLAPFGRAIEQGELGSATRFEAVFELVRGWLKKRALGKLRPLVVLVGDGGLTVGDARAFGRAHAAGIEVCAINAADRASNGELLSRLRSTGGVALEVGAEAEAAARGRDEGQLVERLSALFEPALAAHVSVVGARRSELGALRAGEQLSWQGLASAPFALRYDAGSASSRAPSEKLRALALGASAAVAAGVEGVSDALTALDARDLALPSARDWPAQQPKAPCDRRGPARRPSGVSSDAAPLALAHERACKARPKAEVRAGSGAEVGVGMPADPLLQMLRQRIMPVARGCFRRDRGGRPDYAKRAVFAFTLAEREVVDAQVEGKIPDSLRACLLAAVDTLDVPRFSGIVKVRYPLITESVPLPEQIELQARTAGKLDTLFGRPEAP